jgi:hypothetical protein
MTLRITVVDEQTGDTDTKIVPDGDYMLICHWPCYLEEIQGFKTDSRHVLIVEGRAT